MTGGRWLASERRRFEKLNSLLALSTRFSLSIRSRFLAYWTSEIPEAAAICFLLDA